MQSFGTALRLMLVFALALLFLGLAPQNSLAQTASPASLSFGIPTGTTGGVSTQQTVTINIPNTTVTFNSVTASSPFSVAGNSCVGSLTGPTTCQVSIILTTTSTTLVTGSLVISFGAESSLTVPLSGAYGAIKLFDSTQVQPSFSGASFVNLYTIASASLNLSCPGNPTAKLSATPDGLTNVLVDNYIALGINGTPVITSLSANGMSAEYSSSGIRAYPLGNVCQGSDASPDIFGGNTYPECFSNSYRTNVSSYLNQNTDLFVGTGGIPPLDISTFFGQAQSVAPPFPVQTSVSLLDAGGFIASSSLFLVTSCSPAGVVPGGSVTLNPISTANPSSLTQTATFSSTPGQNISFTTSIATAVAQGYTPPSGIVPIVTDFGIPQSTFYQLVSGTSAAPAVCLRLSGELDSMGNPLCKGYQIQCYDPSKGTTTGDNCTPTFSNSRDLYDAAQFASLDAPAPTAADPSQNFLSPTSPVNACRNLGTVLNPIVCASGTGPGMLLGGDSWLSSPYATSNCALTGGLAGYPCPLDTLTAVYGAADLGSGSTTFGKNSIFVPVVNVPLPSTVTTIAGQNANGWLNSWTINASFVANEASYSSATASNPASNGFKPAAPYSVTYGLTSPGVAIPDTTYPIATDTTRYADGTKTTGGTITPPSSIANCTTSTPVASFNAADTFTVASDGIYNLHYFTTDCALTEGLAFNPTVAQLTDPTSNWASFPVKAVGVDTAGPTVSNVLAVPSVLFLNQPFTLTYQCADSIAPGSGLHTCDTSLSNNIAAVTTSPVSVGQPTFSGSHVIPTAVPLPAAGTGYPVSAGQSISVTAQDFAGNTVTTAPQPYSVQYETPAVSCGPAGNTSPSHTFLPPVTTDPAIPGLAWAGVKKGRSVPYKFRVCDFNGNSIGASGPVIANETVTIIGDNGGDVAEDIADAIEDTDFHWDPTNQLWIYNLRTSDKESGLKYIYTLTLKDGSTLQFALSVK
jgi:hypothetical protein